MQRTMGAALAALVLMAGQTMTATQTAAQTTGQTTAQTTGQMGQSGQTATSPNGAPTGATFDRAAWTALAGKPDAAEPRQAMLPGAIALIPAGTPSAEVEAQLGAPDERFDKAWAYVIGGGGLFGGEYQALLVRFDDQGRVASAGQVSTETWQ